MAFDLTCQQGTRKASLWPTKLAMLGVSLPPRSPVKTAGAAEQHDCLRDTHPGRTRTSSYHSAIKKTSIFVDNLHVSLAHCQSASRGGTATRCIPKPWGNGPRASSRRLPLESSGPLLGSGDKALKRAPCFAVIISHLCFKYITQHKCVARSFVPPPGCSLLSYTSNTHLAASFRAGTVHQHNSDILV